jgi:hypothetical protein
MHNLKALIRKEVERFLKQLKLEITPTKEMINVETKQLASEQTVLAELQLFYVQPAADIKRLTGLRVGLEQFKSSLDLLAQEQYLVKLAEYTKTLKYKPELERGARTHMSNWLRAVLFRAPTDVELAVMMHFIWQVKRKLFGKRARFHMMPVIVSAQGTGKTTAVRRLIEPMSDLAGTSTLESITDDRTWATFETSYVRMVDEMARADKADMNVLKQLLSEDGYLQYRPLYFNKLVKVKQNVTFIGTSNEDISLIIKDYTGVRRFFQLLGRTEPIYSMQPGEISNFWREFEVFNPLEIWQGVNEELEILPEFEAVQQDIAETQENELRLKTSFEEFMQSPEDGLEPATAATEDKAKILTAQAVYAKYKEFCEANGLETHFSVPSIRKKLMHMLPASAIIYYETNGAYKFKLVERRQTVNSGFSVIRGKFE